MSVNLPPSALNHVAYKPWKLKPAARWNVASRLCTSLTQSSRRFARHRGRQCNRCSGAQVWRLADFFLKHFLKHFSLNILFCCFAREHCCSGIRSAGATSQKLRTLSGVVKVLETFSVGQFLDRELVVKQCPPGRSRWEQESSEECEQCRPSKTSMGKLWPYIAIHYIDINLVIK